MCKRSLLWGLKLHVIQLTTNSPYVICNVYYMNYAAAYECFGCVAWSHFLAYLSL